MKVRHIFLLILFFIGCKKEKSVFEITTETANKDLVHELKNQQILNPYGLLFQDEQYEVWSTCSGEWGGTIYFKNKKTKKIHYASSTCAVSVDKLNNKYYVSNSLSHLYGNSNILEISNPEKMESVSKLPVFHPNIQTIEHETDSNLGTKAIIDSSGVLIATSFVYRNKLYSILTDIQGNKTTISEIRNNKFQTIEELPENLFYHAPLIFKKSNNNQKLYFQNPKNGTLEITDNHLKITYYKK